jgi:TPR repeat protein
MSLQRAIQAILILGLSGCSSVDYQAPPAPVNPFDETIIRKPASTRKPVNPVIVSAPPSVAVLPEQEEDVAIPIPVPSGAPIITTRPEQGDGSTPSFVIEGRSGPRTDADDVFDEGMRVGQTGDTMSKIGLLEQAGAMGNGDALYELAKMYQRGIGVATDMPESIAYLNRAQRLGHVESTRVLGTLYLTGQGLPKDVEYGKTLLDQAAETSTRAMREYGQYLGNLRQPYLNDPSKAAVLLKRAAVQGDGESAKLLETLLARQGDVAGADAARIAQPDPAKSIAQASLASDADETTAEEVKARALSGDLDAAYQYGLNIQLRKFPSVDPEFDSYCWYGAAASLGLAKAKAELGPIAGAKTIADRKAPGRLDNCIAGLVEVMKH